MSLSKETRYEQGGGLNERRSVMKRRKKVLVLTLVVVVIAAFAPILWSQPAQEEGAEKVNINTPNNNLLVISLHTNVR